MSRNYPNIKRKRKELRKSDSASGSCVTVSAPNMCNGVSEAGNGDDEGEKYFEGITANISQV